ncbi:MAG: E2/UBC family protein [Dehalococcoidia bacterium]
MTPEVARAIDDIRTAFPGHRLEVQDEAQGGAYVVVHDLPIGEQYAPATSWCGFVITFQYPRADVYPHFLDPNLRRVDGKPLGESFSGQPVDWNGRQAYQVSRRSNRWSAATDTAATKLAKVLEWVRSR